MSKIFQRFFFLFFKPLQPELNLQPMITGSKGVVELSDPIFFAYNISTSNSFPTALNRVLEKKTRN